MAATSVFHFHLGFLVLCGRIMCLPTSLCAKECVPRNHAALFVFGASVFDAGNNNYIRTSTDNQANFSPYGETFFKYPTGRFSDGRLIPDFIAEYAGLPLLFPYLYPGYRRYSDGVNFASAGSGALDETRRGQVLNLNTQLNHFKNVSKLLRHEIGDVEATKELLSNAVYLFNVGTNDYFVYLANQSNVFSPQQYVDLVIGNLTTVIQEIYKNGGRKFGMLGVGPLGCLPAAKVFVNGSQGSSSCLEEAQTLARLHNKALAIALHKLERKLTGFKYSFNNFFDLVTEIINRPSKYGFKEGGVACCGSGPYRGYNTCGRTRSARDYEFCENPNDEGANFASAGAGALVETNQGFVIDLKRQLEYFKNVVSLLKQNLGDAEAKRLLSRAIYLFSIGNNDYFAPFIFNSTVLEFYSEQEIFEIRGRKFGFLNLPPLGCLPIMKAAMPVSRNGCVEEITELVKLRNRKLAEFLPKLELQLQGFKYSYIDFYTSLSDRLKEPSKYGFKEGNVACCGSGPYRGLTSCGGQRTEKDYELCDSVGEYVIFDAGHPTEKAYRQIAELMWNGDHKLLFEAAFGRNIFICGVHPKGPNFSTPNFRPPSLYISHNIKVTNDHIHVFFWREFDGTGALIILGSVNTFYCYAKNTLFVIGDSLFDAGNNQLYSHKEQSSNWPYGETYFNKPTGRYSDGRVVPDFIAQFANLPILAPYLQAGAHNFTNGTNFASAGSAVLSDNQSPFINLPKQVAYFHDEVKTLNKQLGEAEAKKVLNNSVYLFSIGGNDYFGLYSQTPTLLTQK
ncbi:hypothetical protein L6164_004162 [Bauhinia variegata]|uniref:Uncharacterized protein n=1 Tax=Bauhinia variegata TaxID=167791 RepID=A0ACB9Q5S3_BAUVA|nr:hypothetical protein L6164_004162 [Bauhinia variegata]